MAAQQCLLAIRQATRAAIGELYDGSARATRMIFFTRQLQDGIQSNSGWTRRADREWKKRVELHERYHAAIAPMLPTSVRRLCRETLHDAVVTLAK